MYLLNITENEEYCSTPSISAGSLKLAMEILYLSFNSLPWDIVWNLNKFLLPFNLPDWINGVEAYEYPSLAPVKPLYTKLADWGINCINTPSTNELDIDVCGVVDIPCLILHILVLHHKL